jgi:hypothetical protein
MQLEFEFTGSALGSISGGITHNWDQASRLRSGKQKINVCRSGTVRSQYVLMGMVCENCELSVVEVCLWPCQEPVVDLWSSAG